MTVEEKWKPVPDREWLLVSNSGRVRTLTRTVLRKNGRKYRVQGRFLKIHRTKSGHSAMIACRHDYFYVGRLVLLAFVGPCPEGMECCHNDGNPMNNRLDNLRWDTHVNNERDKKRHGTDQFHKNARGSKNGKSKMTEDDVRDIRKMYQKGRYGLRKLARRYSVSTECIRSIVLEKTWRHVGESSLLQGQAG